VKEVTDIQKIEHDIAPVVSWADSIEVTDSISRGEALCFLKTVKTAQKRVSEFFGPMKASAHKAWKEIVGKETEVLDPLAAAEKGVKAKVLTWDTEQERIRAAEQARLQADADEKARKERERLEKEAAKLKSPEKRAERLAEAAAVVSTVVEIAPVAEKQAGESTRKLWRARLANKPDLLNAAAGGNDLAATLLTFDQSTANKLASQLKGAVAIPGIEWYKEASLGVRV